MLVIDDQGEDSPDLLKEIDNAETDIVPPQQEKVEAAPKLGIPRPGNISVENDYAAQPGVTKQYLGGPIKLSKSTRTRLVLKSKTTVTQSFDPGSLRNLAAQNYQTQQNQTQNLSNLREINRSSNVNVSQQMAQQLLKQFKNSNNSFRNGGANHTALSNLNKSSVFERNKLSAMGERQPSEKKLSAITNLVSQRDSARDGSVCSSRTGGKLKLRVSAQAKNMIKLKKQQAQLNMT